VTFSVDANGILGVSAIEERSGKRMDVQVVPNHGLSQEEVERLERESFAHAREDMTRHRIADLVANAKLDVLWISKTMERVGEGEGRKARGDLGAVDGSGLDETYLANLKFQISNLRSMIAAAELDWRSVDADAFHQAKEELDRSSVRLQEVAIARSLREEGKT
jgi:molecular chaperone DnaK (HSP70)